MSEQASPQAGQLGDGFTIWSVHRRGGAGTG